MRNFVLGLLLLGWYRALGGVAQKQFIPYPTGAGS